MSNESVRRAPCLGLEITGLRRDDNMMVVNEKVIYSFHYRRIIIFQCTNAMWFFSVTAEMKLGKFDENVQTICHPHYLSNSKIKREEFKMESRRIFSIIFWHNDRSSGSQSNPESIWQLKFGSSPFGRPIFPLKKSSKSVNWVPFQKENDIINPGPPPLK